jgi:hypothetical protein
MNNPNQSLYVLLYDCQDIVGHRKGDFDTGTHLSQIFLYVTIILRRLQSFYPKSSTGILAHPVQDRKERFVIRSGFHPKNKFGRHIHANFLDHDTNKILPRSL